MLKDIIEIIKISGLKGFWQLFQHSNHLKKYTRNFALMNSLLALEKCGLNKLLLSDAGLDIPSQKAFDFLTLSTICEYMYETNILTRMTPGVYKARNKKQFESLLQVMYACYAYHEPAQAMDKFLTKEYEYGKQVVRDDEYDAIASATLTSIFSYGFSHSVLKKVTVHSLLDLGCGTGEYLFFLANSNFPGKLYGVDISEKAIAQGKERGFETEEIKLFVGDIFDVKDIARTMGVYSIDIISFMFVLHEFEEEQVRTILKTVKETYPQSQILLTDLIGRSSEEVKKESRTAFPELKFVHHL